MLFFLIDCITAKKNYVSNDLSFARERLSKRWAQLHAPVGNCIEKWQNRHIFHFDFLISKSLPNFVINILNLSIAIRKQRETKTICLQERPKNS